MAKGFTDWKPTKETQVFLEEVREVIEASRNKWPLTQRFWLYRLIAKKGWLKVDEYKRSSSPPKKRHLCTPGKNLNNILDRGRRSGKIPWEAIACDRGMVEDPFTRGGAEELADSIEGLISRCQFDRQQGQYRVVALWCETEGLVPLLKNVAKKYGATLLAGKGFDVIGRKHDFAKRIAALGNVLILHMGDLDRSGHTVHVSLMEDLRAFIDGMGGNMELQRIALTESQVTEYGVPDESVVKLLPSEWGKLNEGNHGAGFTSKIECQLEALEAEQLEEIAATAFEAELDMDLFDERLEFEKEERLCTLDVLRKRLGD